MHLTPDRRPQHPAKDPPYSSVPYLLCVLKTTLFFSEHKCPYILRVLQKEQYTVLYGFLVTAALNEVGWNTPRTDVYLIVVAFMSTRQFQIS